MTPSRPANDAQNVSRHIDFSSKPEQDLAHFIFRASAGHARMIEKGFHVRFDRAATPKDEEISRMHVSGDPRSVAMTLKLFDRFKKEVDNPVTLDAGQVRHFMEDIVRDETKQSRQPPKQESRKKNKSQEKDKDKVTLLVEFNALSDKQDVMWKLFDTCRIVFGEGGPGTGKTRTSIARGAHELATGQVDGILLARAAVTNGRSHGAVPGDLEKKLAQQMRPLYDELNEIFGADQVWNLKKKGIIEVLSFEDVQGRTFKNKFVILDEAQNTWDSQMESFLTRIGKGSKMAVVGSYQQTVQQQWLQHAVPFGGMREAIDTLEGKPGIGVVRFGSKDIVRDDIVQTIVEAYEQRRSGNTPPTGEKGLVVSMGDHVKHQNGGRGRRFGS
jgi:phosphate starvation-inducible protein PhoH